MNCRSNLTTIDAWAHDYVTSTDIQTKFAPPPLPASFDPAGEPYRIEKPGRPSELTRLVHAKKTPRPNALRSPKRRAQVVHTFLHHELQAAELMAWAVLAFADVEITFRRGLLGIMADEIRHMNMYRDYIRELGFDFGDFPIRDWFWERVPRAKSAIEFVAIMGIGFEGGNLDHAERFANRFAEIGDERGAALQRKVGEDEIAHVRFALHWFQTWTNTSEFSEWRKALPEPISPLVMRGTPLHRAARTKAGFSEEFLNELARWQPREHENPALTLATRDDESGPDEAPGPTPGIQ